MTYVTSLFTNRKLSRRTALKGAGVALTLPWLSAMQPALGNSTSSQLPQRFAWLYVPNGVVQDKWHPQTGGRNWEATQTLEPLTPFRDKLNLFTGLDREFRGGTGVHAQAGCCWLTSSPPSEALDGGFPTNRTLDQIVAAHVGKETLLPSLELSCNDHTNQRETKYFEAISWYGPGYAASVQKNPREVFDRLFGKPNPRVHSVLDAVLADAKLLQSRLGTEDRSKLDEYMQSIRGVESRIQRAEKHAANLSKLPITQPTGIPDHRGEYIRLMCDLVVLAFQQDLTRVATIVIDPERWDTPRMYHDVFDSPQNHHVLTHTRTDEAKDMLGKIDRFHVQQYAYLLKRLSEIPEGNGTLLDNCLITYGSGMGDGRIHDYNDLPVVTAGGLGGAIPTGQHHMLERKVPLANLWLTLLDRLGIERDTFADSTGRLELV